jgi:predicted NACHT family NTPase
MSGAVDLLERLHSSSELSDLAVNPLLLTMIATVHRYRSSLPGRRVELYAEICEVFLGKRQEARGLPQDLTPAKKIRVLRQLAYYMMEKQIRDIDTDDALKVIFKPLTSVSPKTEGQEFLTDVETKSGLLIELENGKYGFSHLTFQEYLTSLHMIKTGLEKELISYVETPWWRETIRLYCAQTNASQIVAACLNSKNATALSLAIECMDEAQEVNAETRAQYQEVMDKGLEDPDPDRRRIVATAYLERRTRR